MNSSRALRVMNFFFVVCGYQVHAYNLETNDFRISVVSVIFFLAYLGWYVAGVAKFLLENNFVLVFFKGVSPFLYHCMELHLVIGIKVTLLMLFEIKSIAKASTHLCHVLGNMRSARFSFAELLVYKILFHNLLLSIILAIYDIAMVRPKHLSFNNAVVLSAVFTPHFAVACALKYLCIVMSLITQDLKSLCVELQMILPLADSKKALCSVLTIEEPITMTSLDTTSTRQYDLSPLDRCGDLMRVIDRLKSISLLSTEFNRVMQKQLCALVIFSVLVLVEASYAFMYYDLVWHEVLFGNYRNAFVATFACFYLFVLVDFLLLFQGSYVLSKQRKQLVGFVDDQLRRPEWSHEVIGTLKEIKTILKGLAKFKIFFVFDLDWRIFILGGGQIVTAVALITVFQYTKQRFQLGGLH